MNTERVDTYKILVIVLLTILTIGIVKIERNQKFYNMDIYIGVSKNTHPADTIIIKDELKGCHTVQYLGGKYSDTPLKACDILVTLLQEEEEEQIVGRGQYSEMNTMALEGKVIVPVYIGKERIVVYELEDLVKLESDKSWQQYATAILTQIAEYETDGESFQDYLKNHPEL